MKTTMELKMNVWLLTWEWNQEHAKKEKPFIAIFSCRKGEKFIAEFAEQIYYMETLTVEEKVHWLNRSKDRPYKAEKKMMIDGISHGGRIRCGDNPYIYARLVSDFKVIADLDNEIEKLSWKEPPIFRKNGEKYEVAKEGISKTLKVKTF